MFKDWIRTVTVIATVLAAFFRLESSTKQANETCHKIEMKINEMQKDIVVHQVDLAVVKQQINSLLKGL